MAGVNKPLISKSYIIFSWFSIKSVWMFSNSFVKNTSACSIHFLNIRKVTRLFRLPE